MLYELIAEVVNAGWEDYSLPVRIGLTTIAAGVTCYVVLGLIVPLFL